MAELQIKRHRKAAGLTQVELAKAVGVVQSTVAEWERGTSAPLPHKLPLIADQLHCTIDQLFGRDPPVQDADRPSA